MASPDFFTVLPGTDGFTTITGMNAGGTPVWAETIDNLYGQFADVFGGMPSLQAIRRIPGSIGSSGWQYQSEGSIQGAPVQGPDGTVYFVESLNGSAIDDSDGYVVGLDGQTGATKFRTALPSYSYALTVDSHCATQASRSHYPTALGLGIAGDGAAYVAVDVGHWNQSLVCDYPDTWFQADVGYPAVPIPNRNAHPGAGTVDYRSQLQVGRVDQSGEISWMPPLADWSTTVPDAVGFANAFLNLAFGGILSDVQQGAFAAWAYVDPVSYQAQTSGFVHLVGNNVVILPSSLAAATNGGMPVEFVSSNGTAYIFGGDAGIVAMDVNSSTIRWTGLPDSVPVLETDAGHFVAEQYSPDGTTASLVEVDQAGQTVGTTPISALGEPTIVIRDDNRLHGIDVATGSVTELVTTGFVEAERELSLTGATPSENACKEPPVSEKSKGLVAGANYSYLFVDGPETRAWTDSEKQTIRNAFSSWTTANLFSGLNTTFTDVVNGIQQITLLKSTLGRNDKGELIQAQTNRSELAPDGTITGGAITFSTNPLAFGNLTDDYHNKYIMKAALHEVGHLLGLGDNNGTHHSSVMNQFGIVHGVSGPPVLITGDYLDHVSLSVTACDRKNAERFSRTPWPPSR